MAGELLKRQFLSEIQPLLFPNNDWLSRSKSDDAFVNSNTVELPHSGSITGAGVNPSSFPLTIEKRTDTATNYTMNVVHSLPTHIEINEALTVAYDKRASVLEQHGKEIMKRVASLALYSWAGGASNFKATTGATGRLASGNSQTGSRKEITIADILAINTRFYQDDIVGGTDGVQGIAIITPAMHADLLAIPQFTDADKYGKSNIPSGVASRAFGFDWYVRSSVVVTDGADALKAEGAAAAATDQDAAIFYSSDYVRRAKSGIKVLVNIDVPELLGSTFNALCRFGASPARNDNKGVYLLFEDTV